MRESPVGRDGGATDARLVPLTDRRSWDLVLAGLPHTWAHTWDHCHAFAASSRLETSLYVWTSGAGSVAFPVAVRPFREHWDVTTPYGFAGPVGRGDGRGWLEDWRAFARRRQWVCGYVALNPVLPWPEDDAGDELVDVHEGYLLDLVRPPEELLAGLSAARRREVLRPLPPGHTPVDDRGAVFAFLVARSPGFFRERSAGAAYDLAPDTWHRLAACPDVLLQAVAHEGAVVAVAVFGRTRYAAEHLFTVSTAGYEHLSAALVWRGVRELVDLGVPSLHLGGGIRPGDGVAEFKRRFGARVVPLRALRQVFRPDAFDALCSAGSPQDGRPAYFPPYRGAARA